MKRFLKVAICSVVLGGILNGCFGSFSATRFLYNVNEGVSSNVFLQTLVMWCFTILPAYELFMLADWLVINMIEFFVGHPVIGSNFDFTPNDDGTITARSDDGQVFKFTAVGDNRMLVESDGTVLGEVHIDDKKNVTMTNYANAEQKTIALEGQF